MEDVFLKLMFNIRKIDTTFKIIYQFYLKKNEKIKKFFANFFDKTECDSHKKFKTRIKS